MAREEKGSVMEIFWIWAISICVGGVAGILMFVFGPTILTRRLDIGAIVIGTLSTVGFAFLQMYVFSTRWPFIVLGIIALIADVLFIFFCWAISGEHD